MIYEFYGLPGAGKSSTIKGLISKENCGLEFIPDVKTLSKTKLFCSLSKDFIVASFLGAILLLKKKNIDKKTDFMSYKFMMRTFLKYSALDVDENIYFNDHGIIQCLSSLVWDQPALVKYANHIVSISEKKFSNKVCFVYAVNNDIEEVNARLVGRNEARRILDVSQTQRDDILRFQKQLFDDINNSLSPMTSYSFDTNNGFDDNINILLSMVTERKNENKESVN